MMRRKVAHPVTMQNYRRIRQTFRGTPLPHRLHQQHIVVFVGHDVLPVLLDGDG